MNKDTDFYLYAKGWYKYSGDMLYDLKVIAANHPDFRKIEINMENILRHLSTMVWFEMVGDKFPNYIFTKFVGAMQWNDAVNACLKVLSEAGTGMEGRENLAAPSSDILPLNPTYAHQINDKAYEWAERK
jgi:hypothetical protein